MLGDELGVEEGVAALDQARDEMDERDLAGIGLVAEHAFAEKRRPQPNTVEPADQSSILPGLDGVAVAEG